MSVKLNQNLKTRIHVSKKYSQMHQTAKCFASDLNDTLLDKMDKMIVAYIFL